MPKRLVVLDFLAHCTCRRDHQTGGGVMWSISGWRLITVPLALLGRHYWDRNCNMNGDYALSALASLHKAGKCGMQLECAHLHAFENVCALSTPKFCAVVICASTR
jgi:hypothetical protein